MKVKLDNPFDLPLSLTPSYKFGSFKDIRSGQELSRIPDNPSGGFMVTGALKEYRKYGVSQKNTDISWVEPAISCTQGGRLTS